MSYWVGSKSSVEDANILAYKTYMIDNPVAYQNDKIVDNPTTAWDTPSQTVDGSWAILAYSGMNVPYGCFEVDSIEFVETNS